MSLIAVAHRLPYEQKREGKHYKPTLYTVVQRIALGKLHQRLSEVAPPFILQRARRGAVGWWVGVCVRGKRKRFASVCMHAVG